eukprot:TRINITY_DN67625_c0_g1_i1.p1 TRINITY_DN67625_c0_g1~~TRINITY_DN67625_c0_g1_i1.p1  ORF type:complete len:466 (-),score=69.62 TRINITY_DN67625_c0_g1_i1:131-1528(-)
MFQWLCRRKSRHLEELWWERCDNPNFFREVCIAQDGGFSEVDQLFNPLRYVAASMVIVFIGLNTYTILSGCYTAFSESRGLVVLESELRPKDRQALISNFIFLELSHLRGSEYTFEPRVLVAVYELALLVNAFLQLCFLTWVAVDKGDKLNPRPVRRWRAVAELFWKHLDGLSTLSSMQMLYWVIPSVIQPDAMALLKRIKAEHRFRCSSMLELLRFFLIRLICALIGTDAFLVKMHHQDTTMLDRLMFLRQLLGVCRVHLATHRRIFIFVFGGEDGVLDHQEELGLKVWEAMLAKRLWKEYSLLKFVTIMLTYSDYDFQRLALNKVSQSSKASSQFFDPGLQKQDYRGGTPTGAEAQKHSMLVAQSASPQGQPAAYTASYHVPPPPLPQNIARVLPSPPPPPPPPPESPHAFMLGKPEASLAELCAAEVKIAELSRRLEQTIAREAGSVFNEAQLMHASGYKVV